MPSPAVADVAVSRRRHLNGSSQLPSRANPPGPSRRSATSGIINNATSPTSHGQISMAIRDWRRPLRKASRRLLERPAPGQLGQLAEQALVHAEITQLLGIRYHQAGQL